MSFFGVTIEEIAEINPIPDADKIVVCKLKNLDFQFVIGKGQHQIGERVLYFPVDSIIPQELLRSMGLEGKLAGTDKNRVRTVKLRGVYSQGIVGKLSFIDGMTEEKTPENITKFLSIVKWEPEEKLTSAGTLVHLPDFCSVYDIESTERYPEVVGKLMDIPVLISEKIEGQNSSASWSKLHDRYYVNQRNFSIVELPGVENRIWKAAREEKLFDFINWYKEKSPNIQDITVYGELCGNIQGNWYNLKGQKIFVFDIKIDRRWVNADDKLNLISQFNAETGNNINTVPIISKGITLREWLNGRTVKEASNGKSMLVDKLREGIVITPMIEQRCDELGGRLFLKNRSAQYLAKTDN